MKTSEAKAKVDTALDEYRALVEMGPYDYRRTWEALADTWSEYLNAKERYTTLLAIDKQTHYL